MLVISIHSFVEHSIHVLISIGGMVRFFHGKIFGFHAKFNEEPGSRCPTRPLFGGRGTIWAMGDIKILKKYKVSRVY
jgi:hypothetical protein